MKIQTFTIYRPNHIRSRSLGFPITMWYFPALNRSIWASDEFLTDKIHLLKPSPWYFVLLLLRSGSYQVHKFMDLIRTCYESDYNKASTRPHPDLVLFPLQYCINYRK